MKATLAVHKFSSCDGCQLAILNAETRLVALADYFDIVHFLEAGPSNADAKVDIALVEGSITTKHDVERIANIRANSKLVVAIGACATSGGLQALRNLVDGQAWMQSLYPGPMPVEPLPNSTPLHEHIHVDAAIWGCPVNMDEVFTALLGLLQGAVPRDEDEKVCATCKQKGYGCVMVEKKMACLGPVTKAGCGALCPGHARGCYGCFGPAENANIAALAGHFRDMDMSEEAIWQQFMLIYSHEKILANSFGGGHDQPH
jgi:coenzyme F420-reducing hydrogenase gamma subunit